MAQDFENSLTHVRGEALERGDYVFVRVRWGVGDRDVKYKRVKVIDVMRAAATCVELDDKGREMTRTTRKIPFGDLRMEKAEEKTVKSKNPVVTSLATKLPTKLAPVQAQPEPEPNKKPDDDLETWLDMGRNLVKGVDVDRAGLLDERQKLVDGLADIDSHHRKVIQALEDELEKARNEHANDRALVQTRIEAIDQKLNTKDERVEMLRKLLGGNT
jgi:hypothetical protein